MHFNFEHKRQRKVWSVVWTMRKGQRLIKVRAHSTTSAENCKTRLARKVGKRL